MELSINILVHNILLIRNMKYICICKEVKWELQFAFHVPLTNKTIDWLSLMPTTFQALHSDGASELVIDTPPFHMTQTEVGLFLVQQDAVGSGSGWGEVGCYTRQVTVADLIPYFRW